MADNTLFISDLHLEHGKPFVVKKIEGVKYLILAGDIGSYKSHLPFIKDCCKKYIVIYILGNHEFYGYSLNEVREFWKSVELENFYFLDNSSVVIDGIRFIGATLWTDFDNENYLVLMRARVISDYNKILNNSKDDYITPNAILREFKISKQFIENELAIDDGNIPVLITHHLPSFQCIDERYSGDLNNAYFASNLDNLIAYSKVSVVIHGHTHVKVDKTINGKRFLSNPRGYSNENPEFDPEFVIDLKNPLESIG